MQKFYYNEKNFYLDGKPFTIRSGSIHYFRIPSFYWRDRLLKLKECGFNCVETYVAWNMHEKKENVFDFSKNLDLAAFIDEAKALGLYVIIRPGPYICAEWEFGGLPAWLLKYSDLHIRSNNKKYLQKLYRYLNRVFEIVAPRLVEKGGNVLMVQIENEYGCYGRDREYLRALNSFYKEKLPDCIFFTSDSIDDVDDFEAGSIDGCLAFANFGSDTVRRMKKLEELRPHQPPMCMEFWSGWFDHWGGEHHTRSAEDVCAVLKPFFENNYNFNMYMFCGGTNFGFMNGSVLFTESEGGFFQPTVTSYDYCAPLNEAGDRTQTYFAVRELFKTYCAALPEITSGDSEKVAYGKIDNFECADLFENAERIGKTIRSEVPISMEDGEQSYGYVLYVANPFSVKEKGKSLKIKGIKDRAIVFLNGERVGIFERKDAEIPLAAPKIDVRVTVLLENYGRINFGPAMFEKKGIDSLLVKGISERILHGYKCVFLPMDNLNKLEFKSELVKNDTPAFFKAKFSVNKTEDTFLKPSGFGKGFAVINGFNLGRFDNVLGPQKTLFVPKSVLKKGENELIIFNSNDLTCPFAEFVSEPIL